MPKSSKSNKKQSTKEIGYIKSRKIEKEMKESYIDYAMSVIISRALPDVRDGLKPVHRRILYTMEEMGLGSKAKFRKSATVVGATLGRYHPHGDQAVYDAAMRMAQPFSLRYPLVSGQGNIGSIDDPKEYAAMRYTEMKLSSLGEKMLEDIKKDTVDFRDNYDGTRQEPKVLPSPVPQLLLNGILGIAVGMATNIPPHNLSELCDALVFLIDHPKADTEDLFEFIEGPDFPNGGKIFNQSEVITAYSQGKGPIKMRGQAEITTEKGRTKILITEIPYGVRKARLVKKIAKLAQDKKIDRIKAVRDESDQEGMRIAVDLKQGAFPKRILNSLYKLTNLQKTFHLNMVALVDGIQPRVLSLPEVLSHFLEHRKEVVKRRTKHDLEKAKHRAHILKGLHKCLAKIDAVINTIKKSESRKDAHKKLKKKFDLSSIQADSILDTKLSSLARLEREKIEKELSQKKKEINKLSALLKSSKKIKKVIKKELQDLKKEYGDQRKTKVYSRKVGQISEEDLIPDRKTVVTLTKGGYIKRTSPKSFKIQKRGGKGILGMKTLQEDVVEHFFYCRTRDPLLFFTDSGKVFKIPVYQIPKARRTAKGRGLANFLEISSSEKVLDVVPLTKDQGKKKKKYLVMATKNGIIKRTALKHFKKVRKSGLIAINLKKGDSLRKVSWSSGSDQIILVTQKGKAIRFKEKDVRAMGRTAAGVIGIKLNKRDQVVKMNIVRSSRKKKRYLLVVTQKGYGKRTRLKEYRVQKRGGRGVKTAKLNQKTANLVSSKVIDKQKDLIVISQKGQVIRTKISSVSTMGRATQGVRIMKLTPKDKVASIACI